MTKTTNHFPKLIDVWSEITLPLRPLGPVTSKVRSLIPSNDNSLLIMGVTPEFADLTTDVTALDLLPEMIEKVWPGDSDLRRAVQGDWRNMPFSDEAFDVVVNDNGFNLLSIPEQADIALLEIHRVLRPGGRAILRWTIAPEKALSDDELIHFAMHECDGMMEALRWQFALQASLRTPGPSMQPFEAYDLFCKLFPNTDELQAANGWNDATFSRMAFYKDGKLPMHFPKRAEVNALINKRFPNNEFVDSGDYPMSNLEPLVVLYK